VRASRGWPLSRCAGTLIACRQPPVRIPSAVPRSFDSPSGRWPSWSSVDC
jgi:hypothetical protein